LAHAAAQPSEGVQCRPSTPSRARLTAAANRVKSQVNWFVSEWLAERKTAAREAQSDVEPEADCSPTDG
jgi:hypothetical protein